MANGHTIKTYTAIDIEKYHQGLLSPADMHAMEKAALDDPFLADAMEGYAEAGTTLQADLDDLKKRLAQRTEEKTKVIPLGGSGKSSFPFMRAAVMIGVLAGAGTLAYLFMFKGKEQTIAQAKTESNSAAAVIKDAGNTNANPNLPVTDSNIKTGNTTAKLNTVKQTITSNPDRENLSAKEEKKGTNQSAADVSMSAEKLVVVNDEMKDLAKSNNWKAADQEKAG